jgi:outer membrane protein assembly factor BamB
VKHRLLIVLVLSVAARAQFGRGGAEWVTSGSDSQRSHSIPTDPKITIENMQKAGFGLLWKRKLSNDPVQLNSLTPAILMDRYIGYRGFRSFAFVAGSSNTIWAIDSDLNRVEWEMKLPVRVSPGTASCPGGLTSPVARATLADYPVPNTFGGLGGRGGPARSDVGASGEGAVTIAAALTATVNPVPPAIPRGPGRRPPAVIYALSSDGMFRAMYISNGVEPDSAIPFLPANANAEGLLVIDGIAYASTHNCNGAPAGVWSLDLSSKQAISWKPAGSDIAGTAGPAAGPDGTIYASTTAGELVALDPKTLALKATYSTGGAAFTTSPIVFPYRQKNLVAAAAKYGTIHVVDASAMSEALLRTARSSTNFGAGALATWQSVGGTRWLLAAADNSIKTWRITDRDGKTVIEDGWTREIASPLTPIVINGVVFALASGENRDPKLTTPEHVQKSSPAVLYALDGATGKVLWDSGKTITSFVHSGGLSGGASQVYLGTYDGTFYSFGYPIEH